MTNQIVLIVRFRVKAYLREQLKEKLKELFQMIRDEDTFMNATLNEDIEDPEKYITIPHKNELDLGRALVIEFTEKYLPEEVDKVNLFFRRKGAYSRYKDFLERRGLLKDWYEFENERQTAVLREWCRENNIEIKD